MAKKKTVEQQAEEAPITQFENTEITPIEESLTETTVSPKEFEDKPQKAKTSVSEQVIPEYAMDILRVFNRHSELLVTTTGGVFMPGTKLPQSEGAILYKNPFYKS